MLQPAAPPAMAFLDILNLHSNRLGLMNSFLLLGQKHCGTDGLKKERMGTSVTVKTCPEHEHLVKDTVWNPQVPLWPSRGARAPDQ